ncbi:hypothetical protein COCOR_01283 [Corallococcus coralloides DSM 2259]|uniref:Apea-like HEPN domain-containing protein n=1 Tax=Corallococcus coralloides (strain ATCC 25202 / DSM 2259 / NBRC 100086 / M2) TaxID=1144275 RepID=H8MS32_CORCM|nr:hypothetical protein [Corallococcus coralloides]AFE03984.1 hypothetical protein COCOR_01283 [Corallococcus coralloides DSM 2259]
MSKTINEHIHTERARNKQPSIALNFPDITANTPDEAAQAAKSEAQLLISLLAVHRGGAGSIFAIHIRHSDSGMTYFMVITPQYQGNQIGGHAGGEQPQTIRQRMERLRSSDRLRLYVELYREALREPNNDLMCFRFWSLLETIARSKSLSGQPKLDWEGNQLINGKGLPRTIQDQAEEIVFELLRRTLAHRGYAESSFSSNLEQGKISELIPIWYRRRNCVAHGGDCLCRNPGLSTEQTKFKNCKRARDKVTLETMDPYVDTLRSITWRIVDSELDQ